MNKSWRTTLSGIVFGVTGLIAVLWPNTTIGKIAQIATYVSGALGFHSASDNAVTSGDVALKKMS